MTPPIPPLPSDPERLRGDMSLILAVSHLLERASDLHEILNPVLESLCFHLKLRSATVTLHNRKTRDILIEAAVGLTPAQLSRGRYQLGEGVTGTVVQEGRTIIIPRTSESTLFLNRTESASSGEDLSYLCVPIRSDNTVIGALSGERLCDPAANLDQDAAAMQIVASMIAQAVNLRRIAQENRDRLARENERLRAELKQRFRPSNIIGNSHEMQNVYDQIAQVCKSQTSVLVLGETGTGKELVAAAIHYNSDRADRPFVKSHCAALQDNLVESELFGHVKGAFTGASADRMGRFELAHGGTLFLDEIGDIPMHIQIKLLRVLQEREFERVGGTKTIKVNVRIIAATNRDLSQLVQEGKFREDLYFRLNVFPIFVPPLRKRRSDILLLADHFLEQYARESKKPVKRLTSAVIDMLHSYHWPGNVRELENTIERAVLLAEGDAVHPHHMPPTLQTAEVSSKPNRGTLKDMVEAYERDILADALKSSRGNMASAARNLGTTQRIFGYKVHQYGIDPKKYSE